MQTRSGQWNIGAGKKKNWTHHCCREGKQEENLVGLRTCGKLWGLYGHCTENIWRWKTERDICRSNGSGDSSRRFKQEIIHANREGLEVTSIALVFKDCMAEMNLLSRLDSLRKKAHIWCSFKGDIVWRKDREGRRLGGRLSMDPWSNTTHIRSLTESHPRCLGCVLMPLTGC